jgi:hypothetical protein
MSLEKFFKAKVRTISDRWADTIINSYPEEGAKFFGNAKNQFANPAGHTFRANTEKILTLLLAGGGESEELRALVDGIVRIRAVQGLGPSRTVAFVFALRDIIEDEVTRAGQTMSADERALWTGRVDELALTAFDQYMKCREVLWEQKANHLHNRTHKLLERANLLKKEVTG